MSTGFPQQQQFVPQQQLAPTAGDASRAQQPGEMQMSTNVGQRQGYPTWDTSAAMAQRVQQPAPMLPPQQPQGFQPAPQFQPNPNAAGFVPAPQGFNPMQQQAPAPQQPMPRPQYQIPVAMGPDPTQQQPAGGPFQFNDGLNLAGPVGGQQVPQQPGPQFPGQQFQAPGQQTPVQVPAPIRDRLAASGVPVGHYQSDEQLLADLGSAAGEIQQLRHYARMGIEAQRGLLPAPGQQQQPPAAGQQQAPPENGQQQQPQRPKAPEWRPEWESLVRYDAQTGQYKAIDPLAVNPLIVERANEWAAWRRRQIDSLATDPAQAVWQGGLDQIVAQEVDRRLQAAEAQRAAQQAQLEGTRAMDQFIQQNVATLFQVGQDGQPIVNPYTGETALTPRGQAFRAHASRYSAEFQARYGRAPDPRDVLERVQLALVQEDYMRAAQGQPPQGFFPQQGQQLPPQQPWSTPQPYQPAPMGGYGPFNQNAAALENTVQQALMRARHTPNQNGTEVSQAVNGVAQNPSLTFRQLLQQAAAQRGLA